MQVTPDWLDNIHPIIVHFPIALLFAAVLLDFFGLINPNKQWLPKAAVLLFVLGTLGLIAAFFSGQFAAGHLPIPKTLLHAVHEHEDWAEKTLWFFGIYTSLRLIVIWWNKQAGRVLSVVIFIIGFSGLFLVYETGEHGGNLVYNHGIGTNPFITQQKRKALENHYKGPDTPTVMKDGGWSWEPSENSPSILNSSFKWITGSPTELNATAEHIGRDTLLKLNAGSSPVMFVLNRPLSNVEVTVRFNADQLNGEFSVVDHVKNANNYEFMTLSQGQLIQGRVSNGNRSVIAKSQVKSKKGFQVLQVVTTSNYIYGKLNGVGIIHTRAGPMPPGDVGLRIVGNGTLQLQFLATKPVSGKERLQ